MPDRTLTLSCGNSSLNPHVHSLLINRVVPKKSMGKDVAAAKASPVPFIRTELEKLLAKGLLVDESNKRDQSQKAGTMDKTAER